MSEAVEKLEKRLKRVSDEGAPGGAILNRCLSEAWFSDSLAWLLDPKGDHGLGVEFAKAFVRRIAQIRCGDGDVGYHRRATTLRSGRSGPGVTAGGFSFKNAAVVRELYLTRLQPRRARPVQRFCDLAILDLDLRDGFFLVVENKLFTGEHDDQLRHYRLAVEEKYGRAKVREYVFLTLAGALPQVGKRQAAERTHWVRASWIGDMPKVLARAQSASRKRPLPAELVVLRDLLNWLGELVRVAQASRDEIQALRKAVVAGATDCLFEELQRLGEGKRGSWAIRSKRGGRATLVHTSRPAGLLRIETLPGMTVAVQGRRGDRAEFEKLLVPFGSHSDQVFNLLDLAARDIYYLHFERPELYLGSARRRRDRRGGSGGSGAARSAARAEAEPLFRFLYQYRHPLKVLLSS